MNHMKKRVLVIGILLILCLSFASASWWDFLKPKNAVTGKAIDDSSLVAYYNFNDVGGTFVPDESGNGNNAELAGDAHIVDGKLVLDGDGDYVDYKTSGDFNWASDDDFTYSLWVKIPTTENYGMILSQRRFSDGIQVLDLAIGYNGWHNYGAGNLTFLVRNDAGKIDDVAAGKINDDEWHHVVVYRDENEYVVYVDGIISDSFPNINKGAITTDLRHMGSEQKWILSRFTSEDNIYLKGQMDNVRIYNRALSAGEIQAIYDEENPNVVECKISNIQFQQVPGYVYYEMYMEAYNLPAGELFGITGAENWNHLLFTKVSTIDSITDLKATQTLNEAAKNYIEARKNNIKLTKDGVVICDQEVVTCSESDADFPDPHYTKGTACMGDDCRTDYCLELEPGQTYATELKEYYIEEEGIINHNLCDPLTDIFSENYNCPYGCEDGQCLRSCTTTGCTLYESEKGKFTSGGQDYIIEMLGAGSPSAAHLRVDGGQIVTFRINDPKNVGPLIINVEDIHYFSGHPTDFSWVIINEISEESQLVCGSISQEVKHQMKLRNESGLRHVISIEGDKAELNDYVVLEPSDRIVQIVEMPDYLPVSYDRIQLEDIITGESLGGSGGLSLVNSGDKAIAQTNIDGRPYYFEVSEEGYNTFVKITWGAGASYGDVGDEKTVVCPAGESCEDGECVEETIEPQTCQSLIDKVKSPKSFSDDSIRWELSHNSSYKGDWWINGNRYSGTEYYSSWNTNENNEWNHISYNVIVFDDKNINLKEWIKQETDYQICDLYHYNNDIVYVCNWDVLRSEQNIDYYEHKSRQVIWIKDNVAVRVDTYIGKYLSSEEQKELAEERFIDFLNDLKNNQNEYIGWDDFNIDWPLSRQVELSLSQCPSDISEETCDPCWNCRVEPAICPPHGTQKQVCIDSCCDQEKEDIIYCNPGVCSGCYIPKWFESKWESKCIPYGFRFEHQTGWDLKYFEETDQERLKETENDEISLVVSSDTEAIIIFYVGNNSYPYELREGESTFVNLAEIGWGGEEEQGYLESINIFVNDIYYSSQASSENYIDMEITVIGYENTPLTINAYCDVDGKIKKQKSRIPGGNWASCMNNYECESNLCSSGECIELAEMIRESGRYKSFFVQISCKLADWFGLEEYESCLADKLS